MLRFAIIFAIASFASAQLDIIYEWKYIDYDWISTEQKNAAISGNRYDYTKIFTIDVQSVQMDCREDRVFVTTPAFNPNAVPASLSTVSRKRGPGGPLLQPYPNWSWYKPGDCDGITSVWRVAVDACDRLWVLDSGRIGDNQVCPAQILIFDLKTDILEQRIRIPSDVSQNSQNKTLGLLITIVVESEGVDCKRSWAYLADTEGGALVVVHGSRSWRIENDIFNPVQTASDFTIAGESFNLPDGLFALGVSPRMSPIRRRLYFRPLASYREHSFLIDDLHRSEYSNINPRYTTAEYRYPSQIASHSFSKDGILFFGLISEIAIACWNINTPMNNDNVVIVAQNNETLQFASGVKVTKSTYNRENLWITTNRFQKIANGNQNFGEINYRILTGPVDSLVRGSRCQSRR